MAVAVVVIAVLVIFLSPVNDLLPAPQLKHIPAADLFSSILLVAFAFALAIEAFGALCTHAFLDPSGLQCDRLQLICLRRC